MVSTRTKNQQATLRLAAADQKNRQYKDSLEAKEKELEQLQERLPLSRRLLQLTKEWQKVKTKLDADLDK